jgi:hypothetical protein
MTENAQAPHAQAAFINAIREEGTKADACDWLQLQWNESCALRAEVLRLTEANAALAEELARMRKTSAQALEAMDDYVTSYPHMDKGYMADARYDLRAALSHTGMTGQREGV